MEEEVGDTLRVLFVEMRYFDVCYNLSHQENFLFVLDVDSGLKEIHFSSAVQDQGV